MFCGCEALGRGLTAGQCRRVGIEAAHHGIDVTAGKIVPAPVVSRTGAVVGTSTII